MAHQDETDLERIREIDATTRERATWVLRKVGRGFRPVEYLEIPSRLMLTNYSLSFSHSTEFSPARQWNS